MLKKVPDHVKRDRSAAAVPSSESSAPAAGTSPAPAAGGDAGGLAGALAAALSQRKKKVSGSGMYLNCFSDKSQVLMIHR